jgi:hypothetical protein
LPVPVEQATRTRIEPLTHYFLNHGFADHAEASHWAVVAIGRVGQKQASILATATVSLQSSEKASGQKSTI